MKRTITDFALEYGYHPCVACFGDEVCGVDASEYPEGTDCDKTTRDCIEFGNLERFAGVLLRLDQRAERTELLRNKE